MAGALAFRKRPAFVKFEQVIVLKNRGEPAAVREQGDAPTMFARITFQDRWRCHSNANRSATLRVLDWSPVLGWIRISRPQTPHGEFEVAVPQLPPLLNNQGQRPQELSQEVAMYHDIRKYLVFGMNATSSSLRQAIDLDGLLISSKCIQPGCCWDQAHSLNTTERS